jgi:predicted Zn finger-like uncharacterized protein
MTQLTRCPACTTVFRVTSSQLESRQGFVRCGQCAKVFDARAALMPEVPEAAEAAGEAPPPAQDEAPGPASPPESLEAPLVAELAPTPPSTVDSPSPPEAAAPIADAGPVSTAAAEPEYSLAEREPPPAAAFDFGPQHRARSRAATVLWTLGSVLALVVLAGQAAYWFRTELATAFPATRPQLEAACLALGCEVPPPRQTALMSIESSELQVDKNVPGLLTLNATLRNRASFAQAHPSIELTLTDAEDRPLSRRVLAPADYLGERLAREPLFPPVSEHAVRLHIDATAFKPTGYRMFLFHP